MSLLIATKHCINKGVLSHNAKDSHRESFAFTKMYVSNQGLLGFANIH